MRITVYTKPGCSPCAATLRAIQEHGLEHEVVDLSTDADALATVKAMGYQQAPVVFAGGEHWAGHQPDRIAALAERVGERDAA